MNADKLIAPAEVVDFPVGSYVMLNIAYIVVRTDPNGMVLLRSTAPELCRSWEPIAGCDQLSSVEVHEMGIDRLNEQIP